jgi:hypothetical protein
MRDNPSRKWTGADGSIDERYECEPTYFFTNGCQHSVERCICPPSHDTSSTRPLSSSVRSPIQSSTYSGCLRIGTIAFSSCPRSKKVLRASSSFSSFGGYEPNQALSLGTTVRSCAKRTRTRASSCLRCAAYVAFLCDPGNSLLMDVRKWFDSRYCESWAGSR